MATALPTSPKPRQTIVNWRSNSLRTASPLSGAQQTSSRLGGVWQLEIELPPMSPLDWGNWQGAIFSVDGVATALEAGPDHPQPLDWYNPNANSFTASDAYSLRLHFTAGLYYAREISDRTILVNGAASANATTLAVDGLDGVGFNRGDWISVSNGTYNELHIITADVMPNASGEATLNIHPPLRRGVANNAAVTYKDPRGEFLFVDTDGAQSSTLLSGAGQIDRLTLVEFIR